LIENPAHCLAFRHDFEDPKFIQEIVQQTGCGVLLDLNNLFVNGLFDFNEEKVVCCPADVLAIGPGKLSLDVLLGIDGRQKLY